MSTAADLRINLRKVRADQFVAMILDMVDAELPRDARRNLHEKLYDLCYREGVEIVTDYTRAEMGLPPRGPDGWTTDELVALEECRLEVLRRPLRFVEPASTG